MLAMAATTQAPAAAQWLTTAQGATSRADSTGRPPGAAPEAAKGSSPAGSQEVALTVPPAVFSEPRIATGEATVLAVLTTATAQAELRIELAGQACRAHMTRARPASCQLLVGNRHGLLTATVSGSGFTISKSWRL